MDVYEKFFNRALRFLSFRPRSEKEIRDYLQKSRTSRKKVEQVDQEVVEKIIARLKELNFINDEEFARLWVESRQGGKPRGMRVIKMELRQKGISEDEISNIKYQISNEKELARKAAEKKAKVYKGLPVLEFRQKLSQFLMRRGFDWDTVRTVVDELVKKEYNRSDRS